MRKEEQEPHKHPAAGRRKHRLEARRREALLSADMVSVVPSS